MPWKTHSSGSSQSGWKVLPLSITNLKSEMGLRFRILSVLGQTQFFDCWLRNEREGSSRKGTVILEA